MIHIVGAGFSGLSLAWELQKAGLKVIVYEKNRIGGRIQSYRTSTHLRETAANGVLWNPRFEVLAKELGVEFQPSQNEAKKRFIFHNRRPRRWPLSFIETIKFLAAGFKFILKKIFTKKQIDSDLTLEQWGTQSFGSPFTGVILSAAVQGIFALTPKYLNAKAVLESFKSVTAFKKAKKYKPVTYSPKDGMGELISALKQKLAEKDVIIKHQEILDLKDLNLEKNDVVVIATSAWEAAQLIPQTQGLEKIQAVPITTVTLVWPKEAKTLAGFGCLFPPVERFFAAGVLINSCIFANRGPNPSETWIISQDLEKFSDEQIKQHVLMDRQRLFPNQDQPLERHIVRWPKAIPAYNLQLEKFLETYQQTAKTLAKDNIYLSGNYLGKIGLAKIYDQNIVLAKKLKVHYG
ncbi:MAG: FAD-dependent oxidoreductase [Pseudobdellovibrio sp.]|nr:FAD-dependent oxidoreductase [Pseudobdellovibrio sp.]